MEALVRRFKNLVLPFLFVLFCCCCCHTRGQTQGPGSVGPALRHRAPCTYRPWASSLRDKVLQVPATLRLSHSPVLVSPVLMIISCNPSQGTLPTSGVFHTVFIVVKRGSEHFLSFPQCLIKLQNSFKRKNTTISKRKKMSGCIKTKPIDV